MKRLPFFESAEDSPCKGITVFPGLGAGGVGRRLTDFWSLLRAGDDGSAEWG